MVKLTNDNTLKVCNQRDNWGIKDDLFLQVSCGLENIEFLHKLMNESLEAYTLPRDIQLNPGALKHDIKRIIQISYIIDNELARARKAVDALIEGEA